MFLAVYMERINPGSFGVSQPLNYFCGCKKKTKIIPISDSEAISGSSSNTTVNRIHEPNHWIQTQSNIPNRSLVIRIAHLTKVGYLIIITFECIINVLVEI